ncbi:MAG TPA: response regulator [Candidatus Polarisedimenticolaceae bacterium]|nr:response regulator [Candidatus Polarisedimenticolaceae bacterium]
MSSTPLVIVHLEDEPNDAELVHAALADLDVALDVRVVNNREAFVAALERGGIDLILSDFSLPGFDGVSAFELARQLVPDVPFVFVSGTLGEDAAIDSLRNGATDYVLKNRLSRLAPAARRALGEAAEVHRRRRAEEALHNEQQFLQSLVESLEAGILACDSRGRVTLMNRAAREMHGLPDGPLPSGWEDRHLLCHADGRTPLAADEAPLARVLRGERLHNFEISIVGTEGAPRAVLASGQPIIDARERRLGAVVALHDVTEVKQLEAQLRQAQKMEAVGQLAGGVAHDFNNLLSVIIGSCELAVAHVAPDDPLRQRTDQIRRASERAATLTRQLLAFSRKQVVQPKVLDLNALLAEMHKMLERVIGEDIELITIEGRDLGRIKADAGQVEQVVMNLVVNARDAMPRGGRLILETKEVQLGEAEQRRHPDVQPGPHVMLAVTDNGCGMDAPTQTRIFEPFFTTKELGKGTGLGLATVYGIVRQSGGTVVVESEVGRGTTFRIFFPRCEGAVEGTTLRELEPPADGDETILIVEDEADVRAMLRESLESYGYAVLEAGELGRAVEVGEAHGGTIDLLITDIVLPGASGREVAQRLCRLRPELKVLYTSGYADDAILRYGLLDPDVAYLEKPYSLTALARKVRDVLDAG